MDRPYRHFTLEERRTLFRRLNAKLPIKEIAGQLDPFTLTPDKRQEIAAPVPSHFEWSSPRNRERCSRSHGTSAAPWERTTLTAYKDKGFNERLSTSADARKAMLERVRAQPGPDDPAMVERRAAREAIIVAREARAAERKAAREVELAQEAAREAEKVRLAAEQAAKDAALEAERKAARDARYAARKARR